MREFLTDVEGRLAAELRDAPVVEVRLREALAYAFSSLGDPNRAEEQRVAALAIRKAHGLTDSRNMAEVYYQFGWVYHNNRQFEMSETMFRMALGARRQMFGEHHEAVADATSGLADVLGHLGKLEEAERLARGTIEMYDALGLRTPSALQAPIILATILSHGGRLAEAESVLQGAVRSHEPLPAADPIRLLAQRELARVLLSQSKFTEAETVLRPLNEREVEAFPSGHYWIADTRVMLARCAMAAARFDEGEQLLLAASGDVDRASPSGERAAKEAQRLLIDLREAMVRVEGGGR